MIVCATSANAIDKSKEECPKNTEIPGCTCYDVSLRIICRSVTEKFGLTQNYSIKTLSFDIDSNLAKLADKTIPTHFLHVSSLIIQTGSQKQSKIPSLQILQDVLSISTKSIKIISDKSKAAPGDFLDVEDLSTNIVSLVIQGVSNLKNFDSSKFQKLTRLQIIDTTLDADLANELFFSSSSIKFLEFQKTNIQGSFSYNPNSCTSGEQQVIKLRDNSQLETFDFSTLFPANSKPEDLKKCNYHIELNNNEKLKHDLFTLKQINALQNFYTNDYQNLYLVMKNNKNFQCSCDLYKIYKKNANYIHGIGCVTDKPVTKPLDELDENMFKTKCEVPSF